MTGLWLASYIILWVLVVVVCLLLIGVLRQLGLIYRQLTPAPTKPTEEDNSIPELERDGPEIGSSLQDLSVESINGFGKLTLAMQSAGETTLLMFMSPMCETCQHLVEPLNALAAEPAGTVHVSVVMRADEQACRAFLSIFPLNMPVICDREGEITKGFDIHRTPFGLYFDEHGTLLRKGVFEGKDELQAVLGDESASDKAQSHIFPRLAVTQR